MIELPMTDRALSFKAKLVIMLEAWRFLKTVTKPESVAILNKLNIRVSDIAFQIKEK